MDAQYVATRSARLAEETPAARNRRSCLARRVVLALVTAALGTLALAASASAASTTFNFTGSVQTWTVPAGVTEATFDLYGAQGGAFVSPSPGLGGRATATINVTSGASIQVNVGGQGVPFAGVGAPAGGFNGGGSGDTASGGGASDIRIDGTALADRVLVAGGGGGTGGGPSGGGDGGGSSGQPGGPGGLTGFVPGGAGTQSDPGTAGGNATAGSLGVGGNAGAVGGGGGGGWYGGGGGFLSGGGGGSGHGPDGTVFETGVRGGDGHVTITYAGASDLAMQLVDDSAGKGPGKALVEKAAAIQAAVNGGQGTIACSGITDYLGLVQAQTGKKLTANQVTLLTNDAQALAAALGC